MMRIPVVFVSLLVALSGSAQTALPTPASDMQAYSSLVEHTSLTREGIRPWHIHATIQLYDVFGKQSETGSFEEWYASPQKHKVIYSSSSFNETLPQSHTGPASPLSRTSFLFRQMANEIVHPVPRVRDTDSLEVVTQTRKIHGENLSCVRMDVPSAPRGLKEPPLRDEFCSDLVGGSLRIHYAPLSEAVRNAIGHFLGTSVALDHSIGYAGKIAITAHVDKIELWDPEKNPVSNDTVPADAEASTQVVSPVVFSGHWTRKDVPLYPPTARANHSQGNVTLCARLSKTGDVTAIDVVASPDPILTGAATQAVSSWKSTPYLLNGEATTVDMLLTVNFHL
jgi:TonB family protein